MGLVTCTGSAGRTCAGADRSVVEVAGGSAAAGTVAPSARAPTPMRAAPKRCLLRIVLHSGRGWRRWGRSRRGTHSARSEERRVGKECRAGGSRTADNEKREGG